MTFVMTLMAAPAQLGWQIPPGQHILKLSASPDDPSCKKAGLGYTLESGGPGRTLRLGPWVPAFAQGRPGKIHCTPSLFKPRSKRFLVVLRGLVPRIHVF